MTVQDHPDFVSVAEAARILGISKSTVKRRISAGIIEAEQLQRAQGLEYRVRIQRDVPASSHDRSDSEQPAPSTGTTQDVSAAINAAVAPLLERLAVADETITSQALALRELERENGRLSAEVAALSSARNSTLVASGAAQPVEPTQGPPGSRWRTWWPWVLGLLALGVAIGLLTVPR